MIKIDDHTNVDLDLLAIQHYENLVGVPLVDGVNYHATASLIGRIRRQKLIDSAIPNQTRVDFWDYLLKNNFENLKRVIISRPYELKVIIGEIQSICGAGFFSNDIDYERATLSSFGKIVRTVFNYKSYRDSSECKENCNKFNLSYCPYCNLIETQVITKTDVLTGLNEQQALHQLDHFYPQSRHPFFSVSFFNLIPGCSPCNAQLKKEKRFDIDTHFNPFHKRLDDYFIFELRSLIIKNESDVDIFFSKKQPYAENALSDFELLSRYNNSSKKVIFKMHNAFKNRSPKLLNTLGQIVGLFPNDKSKTLILLDNYNIPINKEDINSVYLGKLKRDIAIQLGLLQ